MALTKVSGSILKDPLNLGEVSIGGTLTYEDVTNVDSIGIITARSSIDAQGVISLAESIVHTGDTNTKISFPNTDEISLDTSGHDRIYIKSNGRVGMGTNSPTTDIHHFADGLNGNSIRLENREGYVTFINDANGLYLDADSHYFRSKLGSTYAVIDSNGKLGVNATNPNSLLEVRGTAGTYTNGVTVFTGNTTHSGSNAKNGVGLYSFGDALKGGLSSNLLYSNSSTPSQSYATRSSGQIEISNTTSGSQTSQITFGGYYKGTTTFVERVRITSTGQLLVGTTSSQYHFHVDDDEKAAEISIDNDTSNYRVALNTTNSVNADFNVQHKQGLTSIGTGVNVPLCFHINGGFAADSAEKMRLDTAGTLHIKGGNIEAGDDSFNLNFLDSISNYIGVAADGGSNGGDALFMAHSHGSGLAVFGYEAGGDRLVIGTDAGGGGNKIDFLTDVGTSLNTDNLNGKVPKMRINSDGKVSIGSVETSTGGLLIDKNLSATSDVSDKNNYHLVIRSQNNDNSGKIGIAFADTTDDTHVGAAILHHRETTDSVGSLAFYTSPSSGTTTERFRIDRYGKLYKGGNEIYPLVNYVEVATFGAASVSSNSYTDLRTIYSNYSPKRANNLIVIHHQSQLWQGGHASGSGDAMWQLLKDEGGGYSLVVKNERIMGNMDGRNYTGGSGLARHHRTVHLMGSFICNGNNFSLKTQGKVDHTNVTLQWYHNSENILQIWEYDKG